MLLCVQLVTQAGGRLFHSLPLSHLYSIKSEKKHEVVVDLVWTE